MALVNHQPTTFEKPFDISQIKAYISITLDMNKLNYHVWREFFLDTLSQF